MKTRTSSWLGLLTLFTAASTAVAFSLAVIFATATLALAFARSMNQPAIVEASSTQGAAPSASRNYSGMITDSRCGPRHTDSAKGPAECVRMCVGNGSQYMLVDGDKRYILQGQESNLAKLAGQRGTIGGTLNADTIAVNSVAAGVE